MALQDHFHPPLSTRRHWHAFHNAWATYIAADLNQRLPSGYFAEPNVQFGIEIDVAAFEEAEPDIAANHDNVSRLPSITRPWHPPPPDLRLAFQPDTEIVEIDIFDDREGPRLAGAIELVSPANKDRAEHRSAFVSKCETYLRQAVGVVIVDVVTSRNANLHNELLDRVSPRPQSPLDYTLYAAAYRVAQHQQVPELDVWTAELGLGQPLPTLPFWLQGYVCVPVDLGTTYELTCREHRIAAYGG